MSPLSFTCHDVSTVSSKNGRTAMDHSRNGRHTSIVQLLNQVLLYYGCEVDGKSGEMGWGENESDHLTRPINLRMCLFVRIKMTVEG